MKIKAASGYACYVRDLDKTAEFYQKLGLQIKSRSSDRIILYINWYRIDFVQSDTESTSEVQKELASAEKGAGLFLYFSVDNVDEAYQDVVAAGLKPIAEPKDMSWGNREFTVRDPDGYKLVFFKRKVAKNPTD
jgi:catechol 2,3-dioxygenase-like lactoylglutathione lyase family enzyme